MFGSHFDAIKGTTAGAPGTGSFTPNAAASGFRAWSNVAAGFVGQVLFEDGSAKEGAWCYWDGTTLTRPANGFVWSTTGSQLSLGSSATAALAASADEIEGPLGGGRFAALVATSSTTHTAIGDTASSTLGSSGAHTQATTNLLTEQVAIKYTSGTTADSVAGVGFANSQALYSTASGRGGFDCFSRFGPLQLPTGPRLAAGVTNPAYSSGEPSAIAGNFAMFLKDSTDTNIQFATKDGTTAGKTDTGITLTAGAFYLARVWAAPGGGRVYGLLIRWDTGDIWYGSRTTNLPTNGTFLKGMIAGALNGSNTGTAFVLHIASIVLRTLL